MSDAADKMKRLIMDRLPNIRTYIQRNIAPRLRPVVSSDDIYQDVCTVVISTIKKFVPSDAEAIDPWLKTIARRRILSAIQYTHAEKRGGNAKRLPNKLISSLDGLLTNLQTPIRSPSAELRCRERTDLLESALQGLRGDRKKYIRLRFIEGLSYSDIAASHGVSEGAVRATVSRGLKELRLILGGDAGKMFSDVDCPDD